mgnify:CR=1 FL=1
MIRSHGHSSLVVATFIFAGCAGANAASGHGFDDAERLRSGLQGRDAQTLAPQAFAAADRELTLAKEADAKGDAEGAAIYGERAVAAYNAAVAVARLSRAKQDEASANEALTRSVAQIQRYAAERLEVDREVDDLEKRLRIARDAQLPPASGPADPVRERARLVAAKSLVTEARLLCGAARLVSPEAPGLKDAELATSSLEKQFEVTSAKTAAPIDASARARAACLTSLTKARRGAVSGADTDRADTLLSELSQAGSASANHVESSTTRDERGVVVTLRSIFKGDALSSEGETSLTELGRVAAAHPTFSLQVVLHDATPPSTADTATDKKRGDAAVRALVTGGAQAARVKTELAGANAPVVDPTDNKRRDRNARVDVVFVTGK